MPRNERKYKIFYYISFKYQQHMHFYADYTYQETSELKKKPKPQNIIFVRHQHCRNLYTFNY